MATDPLASPAPGEAVAPSANDGEWERPLRHATAPAWSHGPIAGGGAP